MSLRGGQPRQRRPLPPVLHHRGAQRHELPADLANVSLCLALGSMARKAKTKSGLEADPIVDFGGGQFRLVGTLVRGALFDVKTFAPRYRITDAIIRPSDLSAPGVSALERVSYVLR